MNCGVCNIAIPKGEDHEHNKKNLCEDCYIDVMSPAKFCDPWASFNAKSFALNNPETALTDNQKKIMHVLEDTGGTDPNVLMERLRGQVSPEDGERECAALHRMGKISIENIDGTIFISLK